VGLYLGWDLSDFIYLLLFFSEFVCGLLLSQIFFFNYSCLIKLGPYEIEAF
jgi:hypothetical protein